MMRTIAPIALAFGLIACGNAKTGATAHDDGSNDAAPTTASTASGVPSTRPAQPTPAPTLASTTDYAGFWSQFRTAALAGDAPALRALSGPTVRVHGQLDDDAVTSIAPDKVAVAVANALAAPDGQVEGRTVRAYLEEHAGATPDNLDQVGTSGEHRVGPFVFKPGPDGWRLTDIYAEDG